MKSALLAIFILQAVSIGASLLLDHPAPMVVPTSLACAVLLAISAMTNSEDKQDTEKIIEQRVVAKTAELRELVKKYEIESLTDPLTGLLNRRGGEQAITQNVYRSRRVRTSFSFLAIDLDFFKRVNDTYGHAVGDIVLSTVSRTIVAHLRTADFAIRWGGEEMLVCLPDTDRNGASLVAEKLRQLIQELRFESGLSITASFGVAEMMLEEEIQIAIARADLNLYIAKARGRNSVFPLVDEAIILS